MTEDALPYKYVCMRPLKVEIHQSTVSTDGFHTKSIIAQQSYDSYVLFDFYSD